MVVFALVGFVTLFALLWISICYWVYSDASARGIGFPLLWGVGSAFSGILGIYYLLSRRSTNRSQYTQRERLSQTVFFAEIGAFVLASELNGSPDPVSLIIYWGISLIPVFILAYFFVYQQRYKPLFNRVM
jgi:hypothetical protein